MITQIIVGVSAVIAVGCSSPEEKMFRRIANDVNPILTTMRPAAAKLLTLKPEEEVAIIEACMSVDDALEQLRKVNFDDVQLRGEKSGHWAISYDAKFLLDPFSRSVMCKDADDNRRCSRWCMEYWTGMIATVDRLREEAKEVGVDLVSLRP